MGILIYSSHFFGCLSFTILGFIGGIELCITQPYLNIVHLVHHKSTNPSPWTAYAFHPFEAIIEVGIHPFLAFTIPLYAPALGMFFLFQILYNVYGHLGFEIYPKGFHKHWLGKWINTSVAHNLHHKKFDGKLWVILAVLGQNNGNAEKRL